MQSRTVCLGDLILAMAFSLFTLALPMRGDVPADVIEAILLSNEFKSEEIAQLSALPPSSVAYLTRQLSATSASDIKEHRLFEFLVFKLKQYEADLTGETKKAALAVLQAKAGIDPEHRQSLIDSIKSASTSPFHSHAEASSTEKAQPPALKKAHEAKPMQQTPPNEEPASSTPWSVTVILMVVAGGLLWLLLKERRKGSGVDS